MAWSEPTILSWLIQHVHRNIRHGAFLPPSGKAAASTVLSNMLEAGRGLLLIYVKLYAERVQKIPP
jgi:hypothetical protein